MKTSEVFKIAKRYLNDGSRWNNAPSYICYALEYAKADGLINKRDMTRAERIISRLLGTHGTLGTWLVSTHKIKWWADINGKKKIQETRHAWLDHLIKYYAAKGD